jgi:hypothetical protein
MAVKIHIAVFWDLTLSSLVGVSNFSEKHMPPYCGFKIEPECSVKMLMPTFQITAQCPNAGDHNVRMTHNDLCSVVACMHNFSSAGLNTGGMQ